MLDDKEFEQEIRDEFSDISAEIHNISALTGDGLKDLKVKIYQHYIEAEKKSLEEDQDEDPA